MTTIRPLIHLVRTSHVHILRQLQLEEALLRADDRSVAIITEGSPPAIVMGVSGGQLDRIATHPSSFAGILPADVRRCRRAFAQGQRAARWGRCRPPVFRRWNRALPPPAPGRSQCSGRTRMMPAADGTRGIKLRMRAIPTGLYRRPSTVGYAIAAGFCRRPNTVRDSSFQPIGGVHFRLGSAPGRTMRSRCSG